MIKKRALLVRWRRDVLHAACASVSHVGRTSEKENLTMRVPTPRGSFSSTGAVIVAAVLAIGISGPAAAAPEDPFERLLELNPGVTAEQMTADMTEAAQATGMTYDQAVTTALAEAEAQSDGGFTTQSSDNPECERREVGLVSNRGDIFHSTASTYGVSHGHMGIYSRYNYITEARGRDQLSGTFAAGGRTYCATIRKMYVTIDLGRRQHAADYAYNNLAGRGYNSNFAWNKGGDISTLNCSELVYKAYKRSENFDLDSDGGLGVYPNDILNHPATSVYKTITA